MPESLTEAIEALYDAIAESDDPEATQVMTQCLSQLTRLQAKLLGGQPGQPGQSGQPAAPVEGPGAMPAVMAGLLGG